MNRLHVYQFAALALTLSCGDVEDTKTSNNSSNANNTTNTNNSTVPAPNNLNSEECTCIWEGPVVYEISTVHQTQEGVFVTANLTWEPCCESGSSSLRTWFIDWTGESEIRELAPVANEVPLPSDPMELIYVLNPAEDVALQLLQRREASVTTVQLKIGDLLTWPEEDDLSELLVNVSQ